MGSPVDIGYRDGYRSIDGKECEGRAHIGAKTLSDDKECAKETEDRS
jgi:hypothetical protein